MKFAIFFIPNDRLYETGSKLLGYDIRKAKYVKPFQQISAEWVRDISQYGFHLTITDLVDIQQSKLELIEKTFSELLNCLPKHYIQPLRFQDIAFWEKNPTQAAIRFQKNESLTVLHTMLVSCLQTQGNSSLYLKQLRAGLHPLWTQEMVNKTTFFYSPYIFDEFIPHFSLLNPYNDINKIGIIAALRKLFKEYTEVPIRSLCLVTQEDGMPCTVYKEFMLLDN